MLHFQNDASLRNSIVKFYSKDRALTLKRLKICPVFLSAFGPVVFIRQLSSVHCSQVIQYSLSASGPIFIMRGFPVRR